ncbi:hypothetical protein, variant 2 [Exophiala xenobiotica]|uniref:Uncharacterized protein n=1 Tax=Exophiala xenobiotica TaxID=348802 RepID=A0A0D2EMZ9_9EURO|nr:hypothetical protein, variant 2 [Exophiala xenobiotica]KIW56075.1 hypothetical protein, variant 2 [Exophiala xenobiotica]
MPKAPSGEKARLQAQQSSQPQPPPTTPTSTPASQPQPQPEPQDLPPSYDNINPPIPSLPIPTVTPSIPIPSQNPLDAISRLSAIDLPKYCGVAQAKLSDGHTSLTTTKPELTTTQYALIKFINEQASLPPKPLMVIRGTHLTGDTGSTHVDFELTLNLTSLLAIENTHDTHNTHNTHNNRQPDFDGTRASAQSPRMRVKPVEQSSSSSSSSSSKHSHSHSHSRMTPLEQWVKKFVEEKAENRSFTLHRHIANLPTQLLEGMVRTLLAATKYRGKVSVEFPAQFSSVTVQRQSGNWFTNMLRLYPTKRYEVVDTVWHVAATSPSPVGGRHQQQQHQLGTDTSTEIYTNTETDTNTDTDPSGDLGGVSISSSSSSSRAGLIAQEWWREWQFAIWNAVMQKRQGWVTIEDWIEAKMGVRMPQPTKDWGADCTYY